MNFTNRDDILMEKMMGRRVCPECNKNFNVADINTEDGYIMPPLLPKGHDPTICDCCVSPVKLEQRADDTEDIIKRRLDLYKEETLPILEFYQRNTNTRVVEFEAKLGKGDYPQVEAILSDSIKDFCFDQLVHTAI